MSHDEPGTSLADQLAQLEVIEEEANESNYLPTGFISQKLFNKNICKIKKFGQSETR